MPFLGLRWNAVTADMIFRPIAGAAMAKLLLLSCSFSSVFYGKYVAVHIAKTV